MNLNQNELGEAIVDSQNEEASGSQKTQAGQSLQTSINGDSFIKNNRDSKPQGTSHLCNQQLVRPSADLEPVLNSKAIDKLRKTEQTNHESRPANYIKHKIQTFSKRFEQQFNKEQIADVSKTNLNYDMQQVMLAKRLDEGAEAATERNQVRSKPFDTSDNVYLQDKSTSRSKQREFKIISGTHRKPTLSSRYAVAQIEGQVKMGQNTQEVTSETNEVGINSFADSLMTENLTFIDKSTGPHNNHVLTKMPLNFKQIVASSNFSSVANEQSNQRYMHLKQPNLGILSETNDQNQIIRQRKPFQLKGNKIVNAQQTGQQQYINVSQPNANESVQLSSFVHNQEAYSLEQSSFSVNIHPFHQKNTEDKQFKHPSLRNNVPQFQNQFHGIEDSQIQKVPRVAFNKSMMTSCDSNDLQKELIPKKININRKIIQNKLQQQKIQEKRKKLDLKLDLLRNIQSIDQKQLFSPQFTGVSTNNTAVEMSRIQDTYNKIETLRNSQTHTSTRCEELSLAQPTNQKLLLSAVNSSNPTSDSPRSRVQTKPIIDRLKVSAICHKFTKPKIEPNQFKIPQNNDVKNLQKIGLNFRNQIQRVHKRLLSPDPLNNSLQLKSNFQRPCTQGNMGSSIQSMNSKANSIVQNYKFNQMINIPNLHTVMPLEEASLTSPINGVYNQSVIGSPLYFGHNKRSVITNNSHKPSHTLSPNSPMSHKAKKQSKVINRYGGAHVSLKPLSPQLTAGSRQSGYYGAERISKSRCEAKVAPITHTASPVNQIHIRRFHQDQRSKIEQQRQSLEVKNMLLFRSSQMSYQQRMHSMASVRNQDGSCSDSRNPDLIIASHDEEPSETNIVREARLQSFRNGYPRNDSSLEDQNKFGIHKGQLARDTQIANNQKPSSTQVKKAADNQLVVSSDCALMPQSKRRNVQILIDNSDQPTQNNIYTVTKPNRQFKSQFKHSQNLRTEQNANQHLQAPTVDLQNQIATQNFGIRQAENGSPNQINNSRTNQNLRNSIRIQPLVAGPTMQGSGNNTRRLHHSIVINCPELKNPTTGGTLSDDLSPLQIKRPVISPQPNIIFSANKDIKELKLQNLRRSSLNLENKNGSSQQVPPTALISECVSPVTSEKYGSKISSSIAGQANIDNTYKSPNYKAEPAAVNLKMMRTSISPPSRDQKRQKIITQYEKKIAESQQYNNQRIVLDNQSKPQIVLPISHIHDSVRLSNFKHQIIKNNLIFKLKYPKLRNINLLNRQKLNSSEGAHDKNSECTDNNVSQHNKIVPHYIQGRGITQHINYKRKLMSDLQRNNQMEVDQSQMSHLRKSSDAQTSTVHVHMQPLGRIKPNNLDLVHFNMDLEATLGSHPTGNHPQQALILRPRNTTLAINPQLTQSNFREPNTAISNMTMQCQGLSDKQSHPMAQSQLQEHTDLNVAVKGNGHYDYVTQNTSRNLGDCTQYQSKEDSDLSQRSKQQQMSRSRCIITQVDNQPSSQAANQNIANNNLVRLYQSVGANGNILLTNQQIVSKVSCQLESNSPGPLKRTTIPTNQSIYVKEQFSDQSQKDKAVNRQDSSDIDENELSENHMGPETGPGSAEINNQIGYSAQDDQVTQQQYQQTAQNQEHSLQLPYFESQPNQMPNYNQDKARHSLHIQQVQSVEAAQIWSNSLRQKTKMDFANMQTQVVQGQSSNNYAWSAPRGYELPNCYRKCTSNQIKKDNCSADANQASDKLEQVEHILCLDKKGTSIFNVASQQQVALAAEEVTSGTSDQFQQHQVILHPAIPLLTNQPHL